MSEVTLNRSAPGRWALQGTLDFASVPTIWPSIAELIRSNATVGLSLSAIDQANSAGLAMLVEAQDLARQTGCRLELADVPRDLLDLASMSQCDALIAATTD